MASVLANFLSGTQDPSSVATFGNQGDVFARIGVSGGTLYQKQDSGSTTNWALLSAALGTVLMKDVKAAGTDGGTFTSGAWQTRDLNTVENPQIWAALAANQITLDAGTYKIIANAPGYQCAENKAILRNITDATDTVIGSSEFGAVAFGGFSKSNIIGIFTIASTKTFEIQHQCAITSATNGFGVADNLGVDEVYTQVEITKIA